jgi:hypothetical protein
MKISTIGLLLGAGCITLLSGTPALAFDIYGFGSYWDKDEADGQWGGGVELSLPLFTEHIRLDGRAYFFENSTLGEDDRTHAVSNLIWVFKCTSSLIPC